MASKEPRNWFGAVCTPDPHSHIQSQMSMLMSGTSPWPEISSSLTDQKAYFDQLQMTSSKSGKDSQLLSLGWAVLSP